MPRPQRHDIVFVSGSFAPREGGAERQMRQILAHMVADGKTCLVLTQPVPGQPSREVIDGIVVRRLGSPAAFALSHSLGKLTFLLSATIVAARARPDRLMSSMLGAASVSAAVAARLNRVPHILRLTGGGTERFRSEPVARASRLSSRLWCRLFDRRHTVVVAPASHLLRDFALAFGNHRSLRWQIDNGVSPPPPPADKREVVAYYARGGSRVNDEHFLELARATPTVRYEVFGREIPDSPDNVVCLSWISLPEELLNTCRALVNTSLTEGSPNTALQALATGCIVIGFDNPGMRELYSRFPDRVLLCQYGDVTALSHQVHAALAVKSVQRPRITTTQEARHQWFQLIEKH